MKGLWVITCLLALAVSAAHASEFRSRSKPIPIETVAQRSKLGAIIVVGETVSVTRRGKEVSIPWTTYDVKVSEVLWGDAPDAPIRLSFPGGLSADGKDMTRIAGVSGIARNVRVFVFLVRQGDSYRLYDWFRGRYDITTVEGEEGLAIHTGRRDLLPERIRTKLPEGDKPVSVHVTLTELRAFLAALEDKPQPDASPLPRKRPKR